MDGARIESVNVGRAAPTEHSSAPVTGIDKRPVAGPIWVSAPGPARPGEHGGLAGDAICDLAHHGGLDQAVYAFAREELDAWQRELGRPLASGSFGENLTTRGLDVDGAVVGERWAIGDELVLEVSDPRIPCRTFAAWLGERDWVRRFTARAAPGSYLRVVRPGAVRAGDPVAVAARPDHGVTVATVFRVLTLAPALLEEAAAATALSERIKAKLAARLGGPPRPPGAR